MMKSRRMEASPGRGRVVEASEEVEFTGEEEGEATERKRYARADLDKIRRIHFLVTQLSHYLGMPTLPSYGFQPAQSRVHSGYSFIPVGFTTVKESGQPLAVTGGYPAWGGSPYLTPVVSPVTLYVPEYAHWKLF